MSDSRSPKTEPNSVPRPFLDEIQVRRLKIAVAIMSALLVVGVITLVGRVIYLVNRGDPAAARTTVPIGATLAPDVRAMLPAGHEVRAIAFSGRHLAVHHGGPSGDGVLIVDLATGDVSSRVRFERAP
jgi:hypothetical protein